MDDLYELFGGVGFLFFMLCLFSDEIISFIIIAVILVLIGVLLYVLTAYLTCKRTKKEEREKKKVYDNQPRTYPVIKMTKKKQEVNGDDSLNKNNM